jgi:hypothetical protein
VRHGNRLRLRGGDSVWIPGLYRAWFSVDNGMTALHFDPNGPGMLTVILAVATPYLALFTSTRRSSPHDRLDGEMPSATKEIAYSKGCKPSQVISGELSLSRGLPGQPDTG